MLKSLNTVAIAAMTSIVMAVSSWAGELIEQRVEANRSLPDIRSALPSNSREASNCSQSDIKGLWINNFTFLPDSDYGVVTQVYAALCAFDIKVNGKILKKNSGCTNTLENNIRVYGNKSRFELLDNCAMSGEVWLKVKGDVDGCYQHGFFGGMAIGHDVINGTGLYYDADGYAGALSLSGVKTR